MSLLVATILSEGKPLDPAYEVVTIDVVKEVNRIPNATLTLLDGSATEQKFTISDTAFFEPGKEIEIKLGYEGQPGSDTRIFKGLVVKQIVEADSHGTLLTVELKGAALKLTQARRSAVYRDQTDSAILGELIQKNGLKKGALASTQPTHPELVQYYCTDWDFILSRADLYGLVVIAGDDEISVKEASLSGSAKYSFEFGISEIYSFEIEVDGSHQYASVESVGWDIKNQRLTQTARAKSFSLAQGNLKSENVARAVGGSVQALSNPVSLDPKVLQAWADGAMRKNRLSMICGRISLPQIGDIQCMDLIEIAGIGNRFNGKTLVTGLRQRVDLNGWRTDVQFGLSAERFATRPEVMDFPAAGMLPGVNGLHIGIVVEGKEDPDKEYRVLIKLPGIDEKNGNLWARLASPDGGKGRGFFFRPEPGDEVVVGFFNDDPHQAVVLGALYSSKNTPADDFSKYSQENIPKGLASKKGSTLVFMDNDKPSVFIQTPAKNKILLDDDGEMIQVTDQHGNSIKMSKDGIEIKSAKDLKIEASGNVEIKGSKVDVN